MHNTMFPPHTELQGETRLPTRPFHEEFLGDEAESSATIPDGTRNTFIARENSRLIGNLINNTYVTKSLAEERAETPPRPSVVIPFSRDTDFVERRAILDQIHRKCAEARSRTALVGLGGVGKSQLAIEYAYRTREQSPETWVFWVFASNAARFEQSFRDIADCVKISGRQDPKANIFKLVHDWLRNSRARWILILDNVDDARFLLAAQGDSQDQRTDSEIASKPLREYLPYCDSGSILITTRNEDAALKLVEQRDIIAVEPMDKAHALALFEKKLGVQGESSDVADLTAELEFMPLAIVQAAAYISHRAPRCSPKQYLEEFKKSDRKRTRLLKRDEGHHRRDWEAKNSILITWQISFDHIHQARPSAADLLSLMSFFDRQGIPEALLRYRDEHGDVHREQRERDNDDLFDGEDNTSQSSGSDDEFEDDVVTLRKFSFISLSTDRTTFEMHRLVQLATRNWLQDNGKLERWKQRFISNLCIEFPSGEYETWAVCQALFPHARSAATQRPEEQDSLKEWASLLHNAAIYATEIGNWAEAEEMSVQAMRVREELLGREHTDTLQSVAMVARAYNNRGRFDKAEQLRLQIMEACKDILGADHPDTLTSMTNLGSTYWDQGRFDEAEEVAVQVMAMGKEKLGADHPDTITSMANLASTYWGQGRFGKAEELGVLVMDMRKEKQGADHPDTLTSMNDLAHTWKAQGRGAEALYLVIQRMTLGQNLGFFGAEVTQRFWRRAVKSSTPSRTYCHGGRYEATVPRLRDEDEHDGGWWGLRTCEECGDECRQCHITARRRCRHHRL
ncbi:hypothetical protein DL765_002458 [Monosporascus sp. GIB2]|nr:hypothetical protein DL765_002458 [Monosporascus sp. GIB2]